MKQGIIKLQFLKPSKIGTLRFGKFTFDWYVLEHSENGSKTKLNFIMVVWQYNCKKDEQNLKSECQNHRDLFERNENVNFEKTKMKLLSWNQLQHHTGVKLFD